MGQVTLQYRNKTIIAKENEFISDLDLEIDKDDDKTVIAGYTRRYSATEVIKILTSSLPDSIYKGDEKYITSRVTAEFSEFVTDFYDVVGDMELLLGVTTTELIPDACYLYIDEISEDDLIGDELYASDAWDIVSGMSFAGEYATPDFIIE